LAPAFKARGIPAIAVTLNPLDWTGFGSKIQTCDFIEIIPDQANLVEVLRKYDPLVILPVLRKGSSRRIFGFSLNTQFANDPEKSQNRLHKALMQKALEKQVSGS